MAVAIAIGYWIGSWMDARFGTQPWLTAGWVLVGIGAGFKALWREARRATRASATASPGDAGPKRPEDAE